MFDLSWVQVAYLGCMALHKFIQYPKKYINNKNKNDY